MTHNTFDPLAGVDNVYHRRLVISASHYVLSIEMAKAMINTDTIFLGSKYSVGPYKTACLPDTHVFALIGYSTPNVERHSTKIFESAYTAAVEWISQEGFENAVRIVNEKLSEVVS
jgi:hypothetical protein